MKRMMARAGLVVLISGLPLLCGCRDVLDACHDYVDAVVECQPSSALGSDDGYCDRIVNGGCDDRQYFECMHDGIECVNGIAQTTPLSCAVASGAECPRP